MAPPAAPVVCLEGPSAVGKTTTAAALAAACGAHVVAEANVLYARPEREPPTWYLDRQADRWALARDAAQSHPLVVLDGDPFQPLWYNWAYGFAGMQGLDALDAFYRPRLVRGDLGVPDLYVVLGALPDTLRQRRADDPARRRGGFERHLRFVEPQRRYFSEMQRVAPDRVLFLDAHDVQATVRAVAVRRAHREASPVDLFDHLVGWLAENAAG